MTTFESFCERCGQPAEPLAAAPRGRLKTDLLRKLIGRAGPTPMAEPGLRLCLGCRGYICATCWNDDVGLCQGCAPVEVKLDATTESETTAEFGPFAERQPATEEGRVADWKPAVVLDEVGDVPTAELQVVEAATVAEDGTWTAYEPVEPPAVNRREAGEAAVAATAHTYDAALESSLADPPTIDPDEATPAADEATIDTNEATIESDEATLVAEETTIDTGEATIESDEATLVADAATIDTDEATLLVAPDDGPPAEAALDDSPALPATTASAQIDHEEDLWASLLEHADGAGNATAVQAGALPGEPGPADLAAVFRPRPSRRRPARHARRTP
ncbi:MAG: hypothetical protein M3N29_07705, partial [Chloroflexota bacterium]|nr:hypothetical protein [Chloroflexota bacterium]